MRLMCVRGVVLLAVIALLGTALPATGFSSWKHAGEHGRKSAEEHGILGFSRTGAKTETGWERKMQTIPDPARLREYMKLLSAEPHHVGSPYDQKNAAWILNKFKEWGLDAHVENFDVLFPTPKERLVEMVAPERYAAGLKEPQIPEDPYSGQGGQLPIYNAYSPDGDVTGDLVFVNYGLPADYEVLAKLGIDVKGKIVIAKYGESWRGIKPKVAWEHGAIGCLIYSDPKDDGYFQGDVFPKGAYRPEFGAQRGSVLDAPVRPGDPLTPGYGAVKGAKRIPRDQAENIAKIPCQPISYGDALPLLKALQGPVAPEAWRGALPITYHVGPGPARVHIKLTFDWSLHTLNDIVAMIPGSKYPDEWVIQANHHDAWVNGAEDPVSGQVCLLEEARALGQLLKEGWRPLRTIVICAWDGEEPMLLGSTEWCEQHADELKQKAVAYLNSDTSTRSFLSMQGSHSLERLMNEAARDVADPARKESLSQALRKQVLDSMPAGKRRDEMQNRHDLPIGALGSGSDYTPFIQHLGIASMNTGFGGDSGDGIYHSIYDDYVWYSKFGDPDFEYEKALAQYNGVLVMRLADAAVAPFEFTDLADTVKTYLGELQKLGDKTNGGPEKIDLSRLADAVGVLEQSAARYAKAYESASQGDGSKLDSLKDASRLDQLLYTTERRLTSEQGLPRRPWYKHLLYAPGYYTGYGVKTVPGVREAIEQKRWNEINPQIELVSNAIRAVAKQIDEASQLLESQ